MIYTNIEEGKKLTLEKNSCVFIEIKTSMYNLLPKGKIEQIHNNDYWSMISSINSGNTNKKILLQKCIKIWKYFLIYLKI